MAQRKSGSAGAASPAKTQGAKAASARAASAKSGPAKTPGSVTSGAKKPAAKKTSAKSAATKPAAARPSTAGTRKSAATQPKAPATRTASLASDLIRSHDQRIDDYIARSEAFAQPILEHVRQLVHAACPQVEETIKWGMPSFVYRGKILCGMAAFKQHATLGFWQAPNIAGADQSRRNEAMGQFGRLTAIGDLPGPRELTRQAKQAMALIEAGATRSSSKTSSPKPPVVTPQDLAAALKLNARARAAYAAFSPSQKRDYVDWIEGAKREQTRKSRLVQAVEWMEQGKIRFWKYQAK
ncbi:YdeI/OmpD-associated family protein [Lysobacter sp. CA199]|uniref:YdeI/OmpD-associated family protein n=1 Tax=Lysobacter sp. CA199 TaxID=3455608 RepID=UPI003F8D0CC2